jgi:hypothetical protein
MNNAQLQEAIDKTRFWLASPQLPSLKAKEDAVLFLTEMMKIQVARASMATAPKLTKTSS